jgi:epoxyqueuosine reductase
MQPREKLAKSASDAGIDLAGVVDLEALKASGAHFERLSPGDIAFYNRPATDKVDLRAAWPKARSAIAFAVSYNQVLPGFGHQGDPGPVGRIASFAVGRDYHKVMKEKGRALAEGMGLGGGKDNAFRICVDTSPLSDRMLAHAAGLGFIGRNRMLVNKAFGSFLFLGSILCEAELEPFAAPEKNGCGSCRRCVQACPAGALGEKLLDYKRCISYLTQAAAPGMGVLDGQGMHGWLYGCDECQSACPYNQAAPLCACPELIAGAPHSYAPLLSEVAGLDQGAFELCYGHTAIAWVGQAALAANARRLLDGGDKPS